MSSMSTSMESGYTSARRSRRPSLPAVGLTVVVAVLLVGAGVLFGRAGGNSSPAAATGAAPGAKAAAPSDVTGILAAFSYPKTWAPETLGGADQQVGIALKLKRTGPDGSFMARRLDGKLAQPFEMAPLAATTEQGLKNAIKDFELVRTEQLRAGAGDYLRITYLQARRPPGGVHEPAGGRAHRRADLLPDLPVGRGRLGQGRRRRPADGRQLPGRPLSEHARPPSPPVARTRLPGGRRGSLRTTPTAQG